MEYAESRSPDLDPEDVQEDVSSGERVRIRSKDSGVDIYGRVASVEGPAIEIVTFDRSNSLVTLGRGSDAEMSAFRSEDVVDSQVRVAEDSGRVVRVMQPPEGVRVERRSHQRVECWLPGEIRPANGIGPRVPCRILNVSVAGLLLACPCRIRVGARIELTFPTLGSERIIAAAVDVVRVGAARADGDSEYGCAFARLDMDDAIALADAIIDVLQHKDPK
jgi:hypothetical protein